MNTFRLVLLLAMLYAALLADTVGTAHLAIRGVSPDWCALVLVVWLLHAHWPYTILIGGLAGLLSDLAIAGRVGPGVVALAIAAYCLPRLAGQATPSRNVVVESAVVGGASVGIGCILSGAALLTGGLDLRFSAWIVRLTGAAVYTAFVAIPVLMVQNWFVGDPDRWRWQHAG